MRTRWISVATAMTLAVIAACAFAVAPGRALAASSQYAGAAQDPDGQPGDYWDVTAAGVVTPHGSAVNAGSLTSPPTAPIVGMAPTPDGRGYWLVGSDGGVFAFGDAGFYGSMGGQTLNAPVVGMVPSADGKGYLLVGADGGIFRFGDAPFDGSEGGQHLNAPISGIALTADGQGYWEVGQDGGIFAFGTATQHFYGSMGNRTVSAPIVGMARTPDGDGYWLVGSDGDVYSFGDAGSYGSEAGRTLSEPVIGMASSADGRGYRLFDGNGGVYDFGDFDPTTSPTSPTPAPTSGSGTTAPTPLPTTRHHGHHTVSVYVALLWTYERPGPAHPATWLRTFTHLRATPHTRVTLSCVGHGCPSRARLRHVSRPRTLHAELRALERLHFPAGDRLRMTFQRRGWRAMRIDVVFRAGRTPRLIAVVAHRKKATHHRRKTTRHHRKPTHR